MKKLLFIGLLLSTGNVLQAAQPAQQQVATQPAQQQAATQPAATGDSTQQLVKDFGGMVTALTVIGEKLKLQEDFKIVVNALNNLGRIMQGHEAYIAPLRNKQQGAPAP